MWGVVAASFFGLFFGLLVLKALVLKSFKSWIDQAHQRRVIIESIQRPLNGFLLLSSLTLSSHLIPQQYRVSPDLKVLEKLIFVTSLFWLGGSIVTSWIKHGRLPFANEDAQRALLAKLAKFGFFSFLGLTVLDILGVSITPILASLGVGSLAVALALQDTLSNLFSGLYIQADQPVRIGDFVRLSTGHEGVITKIGWRSTHILQGSQNTVVIPNVKLSTDILVNFDLPTSELVVTIEVPVDCRNDLEKTQSLLETVASEVQGEFPSSTGPSVRLTSLGKTALFGVSLRVENVSEQGQIKHRFLGLAHKRLRESQIEFPRSCQEMT